MLNFFKNTVNQLLNIFGFRVSKINITDDLVKVYKYKNYKEYKETQVFYNKKKNKSCLGRRNIFKNIKQFY
mgnify:CR=1 FL=1